MNQKLRSINVLDDATLELETPPSWWASDPSTSSIDWNDMWYVDKRDLKSIDKELNGKDPLSRQIAKHIPNCDMETTIR